MNPNPGFWAGKRVCVTGGTGFLGWHLVQQLIHLTPHVRVFGMPTSSQDLNARLQTLDCVFGDIRDPDAVRSAVGDCDVVFHTAGTVAVWGPALRDMVAIHRDGTNSVLQFLRSGARMIHTSSVVAVGGASGSEVLTEDSPFNLKDLAVDYVHAKRDAEELALNAAEHGVDAVVVNPGYLIGPEDYARSVMGRLCVRFWKGKVPVVPPGALNFVDVRDVACGHILAAERGRRGRRYILGGENRTMGEFLRCLAEVASMRQMWRPHLPGWLQYLLAVGMEWRAARTQREPYPSVQYARMSRYRWYFSSARAQAELDYSPRSMSESLRDAYHWFQSNGWLEASGGPQLAALSERQAA